MAQALISLEKREKLFRQCKHMLGAPIRGVELLDEMMDTALEIAILDYGMYVQDWLIENQWQNLANQNLDNISLTNAFMTKGFDLDTSYTYAYSKIVGLQAGGHYELKQAFFNLVPNQQVYQIPAYREINELMWYSRAELNEAFIDPFLGGFGGGVGGGGAGGMAQMGMQGSYFMMPAFDILLRMQDRNLKNRLIGGDMTYRITAGPGGTPGDPGAAVRNVHLMNVPGGRFDFGNMGKSRVWYWYYDTAPSGSTNGSREECLIKNRDIALLPSDIRLDEIPYEELNSPAQSWVRRYFFAKCKEQLGRVRGKFGGALKTPDADLTLEFDSLLNESKEEVGKLIEELSERLTRMKDTTQKEESASNAETLNRTLSYRPMNPGPIYII
jgi:hypothetical protein|tara:strand:- start:566 stop:1720 length:1155 start_codon:yes stop_codon:yes gene_type:complete